MVSAHLFVTALTALVASHLPAAFAMPQPTDQLPSAPMTTGCTTRIDILGGIRMDATRTMYTGTTTKTNFVACGGCTLTVSENWGMVGGFDVKQTATVKELRTKTVWACETGTGPNGQ